MPVRIYDIARKLGIESKEVIAKAKELGITSAKVPSSSLDKITAEYLEQQFPQPAPPPPEPIAAQEKPAPPEPSKEQPPAPEPAPVEVKAVEELPAAAIAEPLPAPVVPEEIPPPAAEAPAPKAPEAAPAPAPVPEAAMPEPEAPMEATSPAPPSEPEPQPVAEPPPPPPLPPEPPRPKLGDKVGFIQLPPKPVRPSPEKSEPPRPPARAGAGAGAGGGAGFRDTRGPRRDQRPGQGPAQRTPYPAPAPSRQFTPGARPETGRPSEPKFVPPPTGELITLKQPIVVRDLAERLKKKPFQLIADLMQMNVFANVNQAIDEVTAQRLCAKYGFRFELEKRERGGGLVHAPIKKVEVDIIDDKLEDLLPRPPVVTIMGHVDHGKTTLLDVIRKADVAAGEAGGITQHIGAYTISIPHPDRKDDLQQITFLDTPGHAAFSSMRARGANVTDLVILVVAANDGVMPQTMEAMNHAKAAKVPIIVAVNKCDHPHANSMKVRQQLQEKGVVPEEWGGETIFVDISAVTKQGVDKLLEMVLLQAEIMELKANPNRRAIGNVIESGLEPGGPTATVLVRKGTLKVGDTVICGPFVGKVRALINEEGKRERLAGPSVAVKLLGLNGVPEAGLEFAVVENEKVARALAMERTDSLRAQEKERRPKITLENLFDTLASEASKTFRVVVKADTQGSVEAIVEALKKIDATKVSLDIIHSAVGTVTESDVMLASASKAVVLGFHTRIDNGVSEVAKREGIQIKLYAIIYELIDQVKEAMAGLLEPLTREVTIGTADVRKVFELSKGGSVAGCVVSSGRVVRGKVRVLRRKSALFDGTVMSLRRFQDEVNEVRSGMECGIRLDGFNAFEEGDVIEAYTVEKVAQQL